MKKRKLIFVAICLCSASMASAAITFGTIDFESALTTTNYPDLSGTSNVGITPGQGFWNNWLGANGNTAQLDFGQAVRFTGIDLGSAMYSPTMVVTGINTSGSVELFNGGVSGALVTKALDDSMLFDSITISATSFEGRIDNIAYNYGEEDPPPPPDPDPEPPVVPAPGAIVLAGIGTCVVSWMRKRKMA